MLSRQYRNLLFTHTKRFKPLHCLALCMILSAGYACAPDSLNYQTPVSEEKIEIDTSRVEIETSISEIDADGNLESSLMHDGIERSFLVHFPQKMSADGSAALVVSLHGMGGNSRHDMGYQQWDKLADEAGFITVYPQGLEIPEALVGTQFQEAKTHWNANFGTGVDDEGFLRKLVDHMVDKYDVDRSSVYVNGFSNGGIMSIKLACDMSDVFAAFGSVAGTGTLAHENCAPERPVPVIFFHGEKDAHVPIDGMENRFMSVQNTVDKFVELNQCSEAVDSTPFVDVHDDNTNAIRHVYGACADNVFVEYIYIENGGHTWPGGDPFLPLGETSQDVDAKAVMWKFFQQFLLSE